MQQAELFETFDSQITTFEKYLGFVEKAQAATDRFRAEVIEKVVNDNQARAMDLASELMMPLVEVEAHIEALGNQETEIEAASATASTNLQELELRQLIGDLDDEGFETESTPLKIEVDEAQQNLAAVNEEREAFSEVLARWKIAGVKSGALQPEEEAADE